MARAALEVRQERLRRVQARSIDNARKRAARQAASSVSVYGVDEGSDGEAEGGAEGGGGVGGGGGGSSGATKDPLVLHAARLPKPSLLLT